MKRIALLALFALPINCLAGPVLWSLNGVFMDGGTAAGSFVYDADTDTFSDISLRTVSFYSGGLEFTTFAGDSSYGLIFFQEGASSASPTIAFQLNGIYLSMLTNVGGSFTVNPTPNVAYFAEFACGGGGGTCEMGFGSNVSNWNPQAVNTLIGTAVSVPEPDSIALFVAAGLVGAWMRRRRAPAQA
jgi:hypothetical protein